MNQIKTARHIMSQGLKFCIGLLSLLAVIHTQATIIGVETFDYPDGFIAGKSGGTFWDYSNNTASPTNTTTASDWNALGGTPTIASSQLITEGSSAKREYNGPGEGSTAPSDERDGAVNGTSDANVVYYRVTFTTGSVVPDEILISSLDFGPERISFGKHTGDSFLGIELKFPFSGSITGTNLVTAGTTYTLVTKIDYAGDKAELFVNPDFNQSEPTPNLSMTYTGTHWSTAVSLFSNAGDSVAWDDLVVATTWDELGTVVTTQDDEDDGSLSTGAGTGLSLREAVNHSSSGSLITFAPELDGQVIPVTEGALEINSTLTIDARSLPRGITLDAQHQNRIFRSSSSGGILKAFGLTLTRGNAGTSTGGAVSFYGGTLQLTDCTLTDSIAKYGGAITTSTATTGHRATLTRCTISDNRATTGGGAILNLTGPATLILCTITGNTAPSGGGIISYGANTALTELARCIVSGNTGGDVAHLGGSFNSFESLDFNLIGDGPAIGAFSSPGDQTGITDPQLAPLGHYGGSTPTLPPLFGSPAIDAGGNINPGGTDQRGYPRFVGTFLDIGAVESNITLVDTTADENDGSAAGGISLRDAIDAATAGSFIQFDPNVFTDANTIVLEHGQINIPSPQGLTLYAGNLSKGITIDGGGTNRIFYIGAASAPDQPSSAALYGLNLINGRTLEPYPNNRGGGIYNQLNDLFLHGCTLSGNTAGTGGGIFNEGSSGDANLSLNSCTLSENTATSSGGGLYNLSDFGGLANLSLSACTLSKNRAYSGGGGLELSAPGGVAHLSIRSTIVAQNSAQRGPDIHDVGASLTAIGTNVIGNVTHSGLTGANGIIVDPDIRLAPLGLYGGPTPTMPPLVGSPALDAGGTSSPGGTDQRGFPRLVGAGLDLGAVESGPIDSAWTVTTSIDEDVDPGVGLSLREAILNAPEGAVITFNPSLSGRTNLLVGATLSIDKTLFIDASNLSNPFTISGNNAKRVFNIVYGMTAAMHHLRIIEGSSEVGGGLRNGGTLTLNACDFHNNHASFGGAINSYGNLFIHTSTLSENRASVQGGGIDNSGKLILTDCTISDNQAGDLLNSGFGGGLRNSFSGALTLNRCTLNGNQTGDEGFGGAVDNEGALTLNSCTLSENQVGDGGYGGALFSVEEFTLNSCTLSGNQAGENGFGGGLGFLGLLTLDHCLITGNRAGGGDNNIYGQGFTSIHSLTNGAAQLAPLGNYGGPTQTMPPLPGSPALDAGDNTARTTDQRGLPMVGAPDIGSAEYQGASDNLQFWSLDTDGDGNPFGVEFVLGTDWNTADGTNAANLTALSSGGAAFGFNPAATNEATWVVKRSLDLIDDPFVEIYRFNGAAGLTTTNSVPLSINQTASSIELIDNSDATNAYYRFEAWQNL